MCFDYAKKLQKEDKMPEGFKVGVGNEAYLIDRKYEEAMINQEKVKYYVKVI